MASKAFIVGGTGQIGRAVITRLLNAGWQVTAMSRGNRARLESDSSAAHYVEGDRNLPGALAASLGDGADLLLDTAAFDVSHAQQLLAVSGSIGTLVVISSASVYRDAEGRSLDEADGVQSFPALPVPIHESQPTVLPGPQTYSTKKMAIELLLFEKAQGPVTVLRPGAIHGPGGTQAREWYFLKRAMDHRPSVILAYRGESVFHTTSVANLAEMVLCAVRYPGTRVLNCGDPNPPTVLEISRMVALAANHQFMEVLLSGEPASPTVGDTPWSVPRPFVLDTSSAEREVGYRPVTEYRQAVSATCEWLTYATAGRDWREVLTGLAAYSTDQFDYTAEDATLRALAASS